MPFLSSYRPGCRSFQARNSSTVIRICGSAVMARILSDRVMALKPSWLVDSRLREDDAAEQEPGEQQGPEHVERLGADEGERRPPAVRGGEFDEARLQPDAHER